MYVVSQSKLKMDQKMIMLYEMQKTLPQMHSTNYSVPTISLQAPSKIHIHYPYDSAPIWLITSYELVKHHMIMHLIKTC